MNVSIYSRTAIEELLKTNFPKNVAVISFYDPEDSCKNIIRKPVDYKGKADRVLSVAILDVDISILSKFGLTYETYFPQADSVAKFIYNARKDGLDIICQCEYGESRSSGCAAAILEHFYGNGISIFSDYRYYPNQVVYHKIFDALENYKKHQMKSTPIKG